MKSVFNVISTSLLQDYLQKIDVISKLQMIFVSLVDDEWCENSEIANFEDGKLILCVPHPGWATRLRYETPRIIANLRKDPHFHSLREIRCKISPRLPNVSSPISRHLPIAASNILQETALTMSDGSLKAALLRLANRAGRNHNCDKE